MRLAGSRVGENRDRDDEPGKEDQLGSSAAAQERCVPARDETVTVHPAETDERGEQHGLDDQQLTVSGRPDLAHGPQLADRTDDARPAQHRNRDEGQQRKAAHQLRLRTPSQREDQLDEAPRPDRGRREVEHVHDDLDSELSAIEGMTCDGRQWQQSETAGPHGERDARLDERDGGGRRSKRRDDRRDRVGDAEARCERSVMREESARPEECRHERGQDDRGAAAPRRDAEQRAAGGNEDPREEEPP